MSRENKICLIHDMFLYRGGAERFNIMLAKTLSTDISALFFSKKSIEPKSLGFSGECTAFGEEKYS